jgi:hypothetical protein
MKIAGLENFYRLVDKNKNFEIRDLMNRHHVFNFAPGSLHYIHLETESGQRNFIHRDSVKAYIANLFQEG